MTILIEFSFIWVILFELGEVWWISKNGENGFESDDLWFQQLRLSCHFLTNWFELFWFIMLKDTRHPTYTSCPIWNPALSVYATNINHLIHENLNSIHENTTTDRKNFRNKKWYINDNFQIIWMVTELWNNWNLRNCELKDSKELSELGWSCMYT